MTNLDPVSKWTAAQLRRQADRFGLCAAALHELTGLPLERVQNELGGRAPVSIPLATFVRLYGAAPKHVRAAVSQQKAHGGARWAPVPGYPDYEASSHGEIRRHGRVLRGTEAKSGHLKVTLYAPRQPRGARVQVHRIIAIAFHGEPPTDKSVVRHLNGRPFDNRPENLCWGTTADNMEDRSRHAVEGKPVVEIPWSVRRLARKGVLKQSTTV